MKLWHIIGLLVIGLLVLYPRSENVALQQQQRQEEQATDLMDESIERLSFKVVYHSPSPKHDELADIYWLKKAATVALDEGNPYFNIMEQRLIRSAKLKKNSGRSTIEGVIQLSPDPMDAEYDAREINALVLQSASN